MHGRLVLTLGIDISSGKSNLASACARQSWSNVELWQIFAIILQHISKRESSYSRLHLSVTQREAEVSLRVFKGDRLLSNFF